MSTRSLLVAGTGGGAGTTVVTALVVALLRSRGIRVVACDHSDGTLGGHLADDEGPATRRIAGVDEVRVTDAGRMTTAIADALEVPDFALCLVSGSGIAQAEGGRAALAGLLERFGPQARRRILVVANTTAAARRRDGETARAILRPDIELPRSPVLGADGPVRPDPADRVLAPTLELVTTRLGELLALQAPPDEDWPTGITRTVRDGARPSPAQGTAPPPETTREQTAPPTSAGPEQTAGFTTRPAPAPIQSATAPERPTMPPARSPRPQTGPTPVEPPPPQASRPEVRPSAPQQRSAEGERRPDRTLRPVPAQGRSAPADDRPEPNAPTDQQPSRWQDRPADTGARSPRPQTAPAGPQAGPPRPEDEPERPAAQLLRLDPRPAPADEQPAPGAGRSAAAQTRPDGPQSPSPRPLTQPHRPVSPAPAPQAGTSPARAARAAPEPAEQQDDAALTGQERPRRMSALR